MSTPCLFLGATTTISLVAAIGARNFCCVASGHYGSAYYPDYYLLRALSALRIESGVVGLGAPARRRPWVWRFLRYVSAAFPVVRLSRRSVFRNTVVVERVPRMRSR